MSQEKIAEFIQELENSQKQLINNIDSTIAKLDVPTKKHFKNSEVVHFEIEDSSISSLSDVSPASPLPAQIVKDKQLRDLQEAAQKIAELKKIHLPFSDNVLALDPALTPSQNIGQLRTDYSAYTNEN